MSNSNYVGRAGEYRILSELLIRGYNPAVSSVDDGIDIILENRVTIQVKTVTKPNYTGEYYLVNFTNASYKKGKREKRSSNLIADYVIIWLIDKNRFFIIPSKNIGKKLTISLGHSSGQFTKFEDEWELLRTEVI